MTWCIQPEESSISSSRTQPNTNVSLQNTYKYSFLQNDLISLNFDLLNSYDLNVTEQCISINEIVCLSVPRVLDHCLGGQPQDSLRPQQINCFCSTRKWSDGIRRNAKWTEPGVIYEWETYFIGFHALLSSSTMPIHFSTNKDIIIFSFFLNLETMRIWATSPAALTVTLAVTCNSLLPPRLFTGPLVLFSASTAWRMFRQQSWTHPDKFYKCITQAHTQCESSYIIEDTRCSIWSIKDGGCGYLRFSKDDLHFLH